MVDVMYEYRGDMPLPLIPVLPGGTALASAIFGAKRVVMLIVT